MSSWHSPLKVFIEKITVPRGHAIRGLSWVPRQAEVSGACENQWYVMVYRLSVIEGFLEKIVTTTGGG